MTRAVNFMLGVTLATIVGAAAGVGASHLRAAEPAPTVTPAAVATIAVPMSALLVSAPAEEPDPRLERPAGVSVEAWEAIVSSFPASEVVAAARAGWCESGLNPASRIVDANGHVSAGAWQVQAVWWGPVPGDIEGQAHQVAAIVEAQRGDPRGAWWPFAGERGCREWPR